MGLVTHGDRSEEDLEEESVTHRVGLVTHCVGLVTQCVGLVTHRVGLVTRRVGLVTHISRATSNMPHVNDTQLLCHCFMFFLPIALYEQFFLTVLYDHLLMDGALNTSEIKITTRLQVQRDYNLQVPRDYKYRDYKYREITSTEGLQVPRDYDLQVPRDYKYWGITSTLARHRATHVSPSKPSSNSTRVTVSLKRVSWKMLPSCDRQAMSYTTGPLPRSDTICGQEAGKQSRLSSYRRQRYSYNRDLAWDWSQLKA